MKFATLSIALAAALVSAVSASAGGLTATQEFEIRAIAPGYDLSQLSDAQASAVAAAVHDGEGNGVGALLGSFLK